MKKCAIIIPNYKSELSHNETISFDQCQKILGKYDIFVCNAEGITNPYFRNIKGIKNYDSRNFTSIEAYSNFMLMPNLYSDFLEYEYILIYQLDAFVFENRLEEFCEMNFDYIGAPWKYGSIYHSEEESKVLYVGNGGFSLRKCKTFYNWTTNNKNNILKILCKYNWPEDVIYSFYSDFNIAPIDVAEKFSIEDNYGYSYHEFKKLSPFGAHAIYRYNYDLSKELYSECGYIIDKPTNIFPRRNYDLMKVEARLYELNLIGKYLSEAFSKLLSYFKGEIVIWGNGEIGTKYRNVLGRFMKINKIIETNPNSFGVDRAEDFLKESFNIPIFVAIKESKEVIKMLNKNGYIRFKDYITYEDITHWMIDKWNEVGDQL